MTTPKYNPLVPENPSNSLDITQPDFLNNFLSLFNAFKVNHSSLDSTTEIGNHTIIELLEQEDSQQTDVGEISIYSKDVEGQTDQIFIRYQNGVEVQYTNYQIYSLKQRGKQTSYFTSLPGGILIYFGLRNPSTNSQPSLVELQPSICKNIISVSLTPVATGSSSLDKQAKNLVQA